MIIKKSSKMNCANVYCIYNKDYKCSLDGINIDSTGRCDDCIMVRFDAETIQMEKERQLACIEGRG